MEADGICASWPSLSALRCGAFWWLWPVQSHADSILDEKFLLALQASATHERKLLNRGGEDQQRFAVRTGDAVIIELEVDVAAHCARSKWANSSLPRELRSSPEQGNQLELPVI